MIREGKFEKSLKGQWPIKTMERNQRVDHVGHNPLLYQSQHQVGAQAHLENSANEEKLSGSVGSGKI